MKQCKKCLSLIDSYETKCGVCGSNELARTQQKNQGGAIGGTQSSQGETTEEATEEAYSQEDTSKGIEYAALLTDWVIGYREWRIENNSLTSPVQYHRWRGGLLKADSMDGREAGYYAYHDVGNNPLPRSSIGYRGGGLWQVWGAVKCKGDIYVYEEGFRAQYAQVVLLTFSPEWKWKDVEQYRKWARKYYQCRIVVPQLLKYESLKFGTRVPEECRPTKRLRRVK